MKTYRASVTLDLEITAVASLTEGAVKASAREIVQVNPGPGRRGVTATTLRSDPVVAIEEAWCASLTRRNSVDGDLYQCSMIFTDAIHGSIEACGQLRGEPCHEPDEHHDYVSPGWDSPASPVEPAAVELRP